MNIIQGDIIKELESGNYDLVAHGCNCLGIMGSGVAKVLNDYTGGLLLSVDRETVLGDVNKLGSYSVLRGFSAPIYNIYTQFAPIQKGQSVVVHWESLENALFSIINYEQLNIGKNDIKILIPMIGCGLAGGSQKDLFEIVETVEVIMGCDITIVQKG